MTDINNTPLHSGDRVKINNRFYEVECVSDGVLWLQKIIFNGDGSYYLGGSFGVKQDGIQKLGITKFTEEDDK